MRRGVSLSEILVLAGHQRDVFHSDTKDRDLQFLRASYDCRHFPGHIVTLGLSPPGLLAHGSRKITKARRAGRGSDFIIAQSASKMSGPVSLWTAVFQSLKPVPLSSLISKLNGSLM